MTKHKSIKKSTPVKSKEQSTNLRASYAGGYVQTIDISHYQGNINWAAVRNAGVEIAIIKISGSDAGDYYDSKASQNYYGAKAAGVAVGGYHFAGAGDPNHEAEYFANGMKPFEEGDVFVLDWEVQHPDPVGWCGQFLQRVHDLTGVWCILYMNGSTFNAYNWNSNGAVANCGKWIAWYGRDPNNDLPVNGPYVMHQYTSDGTVGGIAGRVDMDAWYGSVAQFQKYGYHNAPAPAPTPAPAPQPVVTNADVTETREVPYSQLTVEDASKDNTLKEVTQTGVNGVETIVYSVTYTDGNETNRVVKTDSVTTPVVNEITTIGTKVPSPTPDPTPTPDPNPSPVPAPTPIPKPSVVATVVAAIIAFLVAIIALFH